MATEYKRILLGKNEGSSIYLSPPAWECGWYWSYGYLGNANCHYHLNDLIDRCNLYDGIKKHFGDTFILKDKAIWTFCELSRTIYSLKETAEVLGRGGSHYCNNPIADLIKNPDEVKRINEVVLPALFDEVYKLLT